MFLFTSHNPMLISIWKGTIFTINKINAEYFNRELGIKSY